MRELSKRTRSLVAVTAIALAALAITGTASARTVTSPAGAASGNPQLTVQTKDGRLQGSVSQGAREFLGVPYAAAPVYDLRFAPPQPALPWSGVRSAAVQGPACLHWGTGR